MSTIMETPPKDAPRSKWRVYARPGGDFAVDRLVGDRKQRYGLYLTREKAELIARHANLSMP